MGDKVPLIEPECADIRIILLGKTGGGKSSTGNTILGEKAFKSKMSPSTVTTECQSKTGLFDGKTLSVVDTPGLLSTEDKKEVRREIIKSIFSSAPGPHVFLLVIQLNRFTEEEQGAVKQVQKIFGKKAADYIMVLFTHGDDLEDEEDSVETFISKSPSLNDFISQCDRRYHVFNNKDKNPSQVRELLQKIDVMLQRNGGKFYTNELFQRVETTIRKKVEELLREHPEMTPYEARREAEKNRKLIEIFTPIYKTLTGSGAGVKTVVGGLAIVGIETAAFAAVGLVAAGPVGAAVGAAVGLGAGIETARVIMKNG